MALVPHKKWLQRAPCPPIVWEHSEKALSMNQEVGPHETMNLLALHLELPSLPSYEKCMSVLYKSLVYGALWETPKLTKTEHYRLSLVNCQNWLIFLEFTYESKKPWSSLELAFSIRAHWCSYSVSWEIPGAETISTHSWHQVDLPRMLVCQIPHLSLAGSHLPFCPCSTGQETHSPHTVTTVYSVRQMFSLKPPHKCTWVLLTFLPIHLLPRLSCMLNS